MPQDAWRIKIPNHHEGYISEDQFVQFEEAMPVLVRSRQPRRLQRKDRANSAHRHVADQDFEVLPGRHRRAGLAEIPVEDADLVRLPAEPTGFGH